MSDTNSTPLQDFLEKYVSDGLKREWDFDEAVWRSLPAFVTTLGLLCALQAYVFIHLMSGWRGPESYAALIPACCAVGATTVGAWQLRYAIQSKRHRYPRDELELCNWAECLKAHHESSGLSVGESETRALVELRAFALRDAAETASNNHGVNVKKMIGRTHAARSLFLAAVFTLMAGAVVVFLDSPFMKESSHERQTGLTAPAAAVTSPTAAPATAPVG